MNSIDGAMRRYPGADRGAVIVAVRGSEMYEVVLNLCAIKICLEVKGVIYYVTNVQEYNKLATRKIELCVFQDMRDIVVIGLAI